MGLNVVPVAALTNRMYSYDFPWLHPGKRCLTNVARFHVCNDNCMKRLMFTTACVPIRQYIIIMLSTSRINASRHIYLSTILCAA